MKKVYYVLKPSDFEFFSAVDREGEFEFERFRRIRTRR